MNTSFPTPDVAIHPQTITDPPPGFTVGIVSLGGVRTLRTVSAETDRPKTSSVHASKDSNGKNTEKEKDKTKFAKNENFAVSTIEQQYPLPTAPPSLPIGDELLQIRLTIIERRGKPQELQHPFSLNEDQI
ncbi:hypothetical protein TNCV_3716691 [Trichonephila clavipes]|nr:hypothetical protein TNCV_3716691 [Trichonephila clavipes]